MVLKPTLNTMNLSFPSFSKKMYTPRENFENNLKSFFLLLFFYQFLLPRVPKFTVQTGLEPLVYIIFFFVFKTEQIESKIKFNLKMP